VASLLLFDPGALPDDFDARARGDPYELLEQLTAAGRAYWINTGADGAYLLHAYVEEPVPASLQPYIRDPLTAETFVVPTGRLYFTGAEYGFRDDDRFLRKHPHMGGVFTVRPGVYRLTLWRTEYPEGLPEQRLREQVSPWAYRLHQGMGWLVMMAALGFVGLSVTAPYAPRDFWIRYLLPVCGLLVLVPIVVARLRPYREARERYRAIAWEFPSIVAQLEFHGAAEPGAAPDPRRGKCFQGSSSFSGGGQVNSVVRRQAEGAMYVVGKVLVGLGIALLVMGGVALVAGAPVIGGLICIGCVPVPMIVGGIALVRRAEDRARGGDVPPAECPVTAGVERIGITGILDRVRAFDLNQLNWLGWLLLLGTFGFALAEAAALVWMWPGGWDRRLAKPAALVMLFLAIGFFAGTRWLLGQLGVSIYRRERGRAEPSAAADRRGM
jgi:hypothetical protein